MTNQVHQDSTNESGTSANASPTLITECAEWERKFKEILTFVDTFDHDHLERTYSEFAKFLYSANERLSGPLHPAVKYYRLRKSGKKSQNGAQHARSSNPQRTDARVRQRRQDQYQFELAQFEYYNQRRKVARKVLQTQTKSGPCTIAISELENHFKSVLESPNAHILDHYLTCDAREDVTVSIEEVDKAIKSVNLDTSPGYDRILIRTIRDLKIGIIIKTIIEIMLITGTVPSKLSEGKTILIDKGGDPNSIADWRPITIYSVVRRIIERVLDGQLRAQLNLNTNQRGFVTGVPGCHVNAALINACLKDAKVGKKDCTVVFLDISKAFDRIGHDHIERSLAAQSVSNNLKGLIMALLSNNTVHIDIGKVKSGPIKISRSVPQGGPLSPILFNLAIDFIYREVCDAQFANNFGYQLSEGLDALSLTGFADDQAVTSSSITGARRIVELTQSLFEQIGLQVNSSKSVAINIQKGKLVAGTLELCEGEPIHCIGSETRIKYLGCSYNDELVFDSRVVGKLTESMNSLIVSPLLKRDQKLNILNQYVLPMLTYPLQAAPLRKIPPEDITILDRSIRTTVKAIIGLPTSTATNMIYAPRKYRGLGVIQCKWEVYLQHFSIAKKLSTLPDELFHSVFDCENEMNECRMALATEGQTAQQIRTALREKAFDEWAALDYQGIGVKHFKTYPKANRFMVDKSNLSGSEWVAAVKLNTNYANLNGVPGVNEQSQDRRCRRCPSENQSREIPSHVLGFCRFGLNRRNNRHHNIKHWIARLLKEKGFRCYDEVKCIDGQGSNRSVDILAFEPNTNKAFIIDPTIRYESNVDMDLVVQQEKQAIYGTCSTDLNNKYSQYGDREYEVIGLWLGARGSIGTGVTDFFDRFHLDKGLLPEITEAILVDSIHMIHHHIYASN